MNPYHNFYIILDLIHLLLSMCNAGMLNALKIRLYLPYNIKQSSKSK